jgi:hypothetical protein
MDYKEIRQLATDCFNSGYFDIDNVEQAIVRIVQGQELGIGAVSALRGVKVIHGNPQLTAGLIGALVKRSERYDYHVEVHTDSECVIHFLATRPPSYTPDLLGTSTFTLKDAQKAGLVDRKGSLWRKFPKSLCFARALTNGARTYCPDVFGGAIYYEGEIEGDTGSESPNAPISSAKQTGANSGRSDGQAQVADFPDDQPNGSESDAAGGAESKWGETVPPGSAAEQAAKKYGVRNTDAFMGSDEPLPENREDDDVEYHDPVTIVQEVFDAVPVSEEEFASKVPNKNVQRTAKPPSDKQISFLYSLLEQHNVPEGQREALAKNVVKPWSSKEASEHIGHLKEARTKLPMNWQNALDELAGGVLTAEQMAWVQWVEAFCNEFEIVDCSIVESYMKHCYGGGNVQEYYDLPIRILHDIDSGEAGYDRSVIYRGIQKAYREAQGTA